MGTETEVHRHVSVLCVHNLHPPSWMHQNNKQPSSHLHVRHRIHTWPLCNLKQDHAAACKSIVCWGSYSQRIVCSIRSWEIRVVCKLKIRLRSLSVVQQNTWRWRRQTSDEKDFRGHRFDPCNRKMYLLKFTWLKSRQVDLLVLKMALMNNKQLSYSLCAAKRHQLYLDWNTV